MILDGNHTREKEMIVTIYVSAIWGKNADGRGVSNYRVREHDTAAEARAAVEANARELTADGFRLADSRTIRGECGVGNCRVSIYENGAGGTRETGYWSQEATGECNPGHCEAAYLCRE